jgi:hypothetical protein
MSTPAPTQNAKNEEIDILEDDEFEEFEDQGIVLVSTAIAN